MADSSSLPFSSDIAQITLLYHANCALENHRIRGCKNKFMQKKAYKLKCQKQDRGKTNKEWVHFVHYNEPPLIHITAINKTRHYNQIISNSRA